MPTVTLPQDTLFTFDVLGRYGCNTLEEAVNSINPQMRPARRMFDFIIIGGGSFGAVLASHLLSRDRTQAHRILVLEAGPFALPEHVQNLPGNFAPPGKNKPGTVWGQPWISDSPMGFNQDFPGLAYSVGGRSLFWGGWSPYLIDSEVSDPSWPANVRKDLKEKVLPRGSANPTESYLDEAARQIGTDTTNDFVFGPLHSGMRKRLFDGLSAISPGLGQDMLTGKFGSLNEELDLEAPLAVSSASPRAGFFGLNKFNGVQLLLQAARAAQGEAQASGGTADDQDAVKRLMLVSNAYVTRLERSGNSITGIFAKSEGVERRIEVPADGKVFLALGTIENTRLAQNTVPEKNLIGRNLMAHLRSNLTFRVPRSAFGAALDPTLHPETRELQISALFVKGIHTHPIDNSKGHYHFQITASGVGEAGKNSEAELFQKIPNIDDLDQFKDLTDKWIVVTVRSIGEIVGDKTSTDPQNRITQGPPDGNGVPVAKVRLETNWSNADDPRKTGNTPDRTKENDLWTAMHKASIQVSTIFATGGTIQYLSKPNDPPNAQWQDPPALFSDCADTLSSTHHESGTLWMGESAQSSVSDEWGRIWEMQNLYAVGPALLPTMGSPNPMLSGVALARRLGDHLVPTAAPPAAAEAGFQYLFDGSKAQFSNWRMAGGGGFALFERMLIAQQDAKGIGLLFYEPQQFENFVLRLDFLLAHPFGPNNDNSGVFVRFRDPRLPDPAPNPIDGTSNTAFVAVHTGFEIQIDEEARKDSRFPSELDGAFFSHTGSIYKIKELGTAPGQQQYQNNQRLLAGQWHQYEIEVTGQTYIVRLNGQETTRFTRKSDDVLRGNPPSIDSHSGFIGVQTHTGRVAFANIRIKLV
ncbi:MAG TPA: family 16 glycoside hydrolase [Chthoniobacterales bacterium]|nr:family 16 glycoside hydrolase [Chthoniobacterales bacterium]